MRERLRIPLESRVTTPVVWLLAAVLVAIGGFIVLRVHHAVRAGEQRLLDRVALVAAATRGPLPRSQASISRSCRRDGRVLDGRLPDRDRPRVSSCSPGGPEAHAGCSGAAPRPSRLRGCASRWPTPSSSPPRAACPSPTNRRLVAIEAEGLIPIGFIALGLAVLGFERAARRHRRRLERLGQVAERLDRGELEARTGEHGGDELGGVGVRLDVLADRSPDARAVARARCSRRSRTTSARRSR